LIGIGNGFLHFSDGNELVIHGLGTTIPGSSRKGTGVLFASECGIAGELTFRLPRGRAPDVRKNFPCA